MDVLVTGASSGFGRLTVETLAGRGHRVFAGMRDIKGGNAPAAAELAGVQGLRVVELDVTSQESADRAVAEVLAHAGRLDAVVNNAGGIFPGALEAFSAEEAARQFDLNVLGALRVNRAAVPRMRTQGNGVLIQIGSVAGRVTVPFSGLYAASKAALGSLTDAWRHELAPFGVESVIVEPASYPTNIGLNAVLPADAERMAPYAEAMGGFTDGLIKRLMDHAGEPQAVADAVVALVEAPVGKRPLRTVVAPAAQEAAVRRLYEVAAATAGAV